MSPPALFERLRAWWLKRRPRPLDELLSVEFDESAVRVVVLERLETNWNQQFLWQDIERVCFQDAGLMQSDVLFISVQGREKAVVVLMEARGALSFFGALTERGYFPEHVWRRAIGETSGGTHCWPPHENAA
jgi:hypothetical protein